MQAHRELRPTVKAAEIGVCEYLRQLNCTVRTEVKEDYGIAALYQTYRLTIRFNDNRWFNEFVKYGFLIRFFNRLSGSVYFGPSP